MKGKRKDIKYKPTKMSIELSSEDLSTIVRDQCSPSKKHLKWVKQMLGTRNPYFVDNKELYYVVLDKLTKLDKFTCVPHIYGKLIFLNF
jgi:hypothetical protein